MGRAVNIAGGVAGTSLSMNYEPLATSWSDGGGGNGGSVTILEHPAGLFGEAYGINASGVIAGTVSDVGGGSSRAAMWKNGSIKLLPEVSSQPLETVVGSLGRAIGDADWVVGATYFSTPHRGYLRATVWMGESAVDLGTLGGFSSLAQGINSAGAIVGWSETSDGRSRAALWRDGSIIDLGTMGGSLSEAFDVNDSGVIVGSSYTAGDTESHATIWINNLPYALESLGGTNSVAYSINNAGFAVGTSTNSEGWLRATLWNGFSVVDLNSLLTEDVTSSGWRLWGATSISDNKLITGHAYNEITGEYSAYILSPAKIPEPNTFLLVAVGVFGLLRVRKVVSFRLKRGSFLYPDTFLYSMSESTKEALIYSEPAKY